METEGARELALCSGQLRNCRRMIRWRLCAQDTGEPRSQAPARCLLSGVGLTLPAPHRAPKKPLASGHPRPSLPLPGVVIPILLHLRSHHGQAAPHDHLCRAPLLGRAPGPPAAAACFPDEAEAPQGGNLCLVCSSLGFQCQRGSRHTIDAQ